MKLSIAEGLYLIALDDEEGRILAVAEDTIVPGVIAACIFELYLHNKISLAGGKISVRDTGGTGNIIMDNILHKIENGVDVITQVKKLSNTFKDIQNDLNVLLEQRGILKREETKLLWIPLSERMGNANYAFEKEIRDVSRNIVFKGFKPKADYAVLFALISYCDLLIEIFQDEEEQIDAEKIGKDINSFDMIDKDLSGAMEEVKDYMRTISERFK